MNPCKVTPFRRHLVTHLGEESVIMPKNTTQRSRPVFKPEPLDPEARALTIRTLQDPLLIVIQRIFFHSSHSNTSHKFDYIMIWLDSFFILRLFYYLEVFKTRQQTRLSAQKQFCSCVSNQRVIKLGLRQSALHLISTRSLAIRKLNGPLRNVDP